MRSIVKRIQISRHDLQAREIQIFTICFQCLKKKVKVDREDIRMELLEQEEKEALERRSRQDFEKIVRTGIETRESLRNQMEEKKERERRRVQEDLRYKEEVIAKMKEDERREFLKCEKSRLKMVENRKYIEAMMDDRRRRMAEEMSRKVQMDECERLADEEKRKMIEEERIHILQEHIPKVINYVPPCLLRDDDWQKLGFNSLEEMRRAQMK